MWYDAQASVDWSEAQGYLSRVCPVMRKIIRRVGACTLVPRTDYFCKLCQSIFAQQLSTKVATVLYGRFAATFPRKTPTPSAVVKFLMESDDAAIRAVGLSRQKRVYVLDLARRFACREINTRKFAGMSDEQIIDALTHIKGIGRWTVEMLLIFALNRPDVWPVDDLGIRRNVMLAYGLKEMPGKKELMAVGEGLRPWRTVASWYFWRNGDSARKRAG